MPVEGRGQDDGSDSLSRINLWFDACRGERERPRHESALDVTFHFGRVGRRPIGRKREEAKVKSSPASN